MDTSGEARAVADRPGEPATPTGVASPPSRAELGSRLLASVAGPASAGGQSRKVGVLVAAGVAAVLAAGWVWWGSVGSAPVGGSGAAGDDAPAAGAAPAPVTGRAGLSDMIMVHVAGAVVRPGVVTVPAGSRVADVVAAAGGAARGANVAIINLAAPVSDGDQVVVPSAVAGGVETGASGEVAATGTAGAVAGDGKLSLNRAGAAELEALPGVGPVIASRIVAHRDSAGPFETAEDLLDVPGIGEAKLAAIRDLVTVP